MTMDIEIEVVRLRRSRRIQSETETADDLLVLLLKLQQEVADRLHAL